MKYLSVVAYVEIRVSNSQMELVEETFPLNFTTTLYRRSGGSYFFSFFFFSLFSFYFFVFFFFFLFFFLPNFLPTKNTCVCIVRNLL